MAYVFALATGGTASTTGRQSGTAIKRFRQWHGVFPNRIWLIRLEAVSAAESKRSTCMILTGTSSPLHRFALPNGAVTTVRT
ncbi:hypothetical protein LMH87_009773 [Akanthomyces muscarius]|uniref:Uncharacterized protein n=1 Tax=Akanthomyces muscarius TaxID=2231603 RepID=A0A9W8QE69_AKAMU|nr:hypothetical protein LMH87_009773 [Akanthomyces muscarius]KAJ4153278.1 hypothetical protein LMH87_009773 [Akanthomyces muscarius]